MVLDAIDLSIEPNTTVGIVGPQGRENDPDAFVPRVP